MSWEDRDWNRDGRGAGGMRPGGDWRGVRPSLDNPMSWSVSIGRYFGIDVRVHFVFLLFVLIDLFKSLGEADIGDAVPVSTFFVIISLGGLFILVLLHEFGHCFACRSVGGDANEILMWPLGGLAYCRPPHIWRAHLWTAAGGPLVNVVFIGLFAMALGAMTGSWGAAALPGPWARSVPIDLHTNTELSVWLIARMNMMLLLFNLLPMFPLDGGRLAQALLWPRLGYARSMRIAVRIGYFGALALGIYGVVVVDMWLIGIAIFGGYTCYMTYRQLQFTEEFMGFDYAQHAMNLEEESRKPVKAASRRQAQRDEKTAAQREQDERELDRLLDKIAREGMASLTSKEKRWLENQSKKKRQ